MNIMDLLNARRNKDTNSSISTKPDKTLAEKVRENNGGLADIIFSANPRLRNYTPSNELREHGITQNHFENMADFNLLMARRQGFLNKVGDSIVRAVGDTVLDTGAAFADMATLPYDLFNYMTGTNSDYQNPVSQFLNETREKLDQEFKIYREDPNTIKTGGLSDYTWWLDNFPTLFSSLTMMIPSVTATKGLPKLFSYANKLRKEAKAASKLAKAEKATKTVDTAEDAAAIAGRQTSKAMETAAAKDAAGKSPSRFDNVWTESNKSRLGTAGEVIANGVLSRALENYQEARGVYNNVFNMSKEELDSMERENPDKYFKFIEENGYQGMSNVDIAKAIAQKSADEDFKGNIANVMFDIIQFAGLRSMWKANSGFKPSNWIKGKNKESIRAISGAAAEKAVINNSPLARAARMAKKGANTLWNNKVFIAEQGTEGIEEIVNYISEQEGIHVGKSMLGQEDNLSPEYWQRVSDYFENGELWDSAFWGFLGGLIFGSVGDRAINYLDHQSWRSAQEEAQEKIINSRGEKFARTVNRLRETTDGMLFDENDNPIPIKGLTKEQTEYQKNKIISDFITQIGLDEASVGTGDLLTELMQDDGIRKYFVDKGVVSEEESKPFMDSIVTKLQEVQNDYNNELVQLRDKVDNINGKIDGFILPQYINHLAVKNVKNKHQQKEIQDAINEVNAEISKVDKTGIGAKYDNIIQAIDASSEINRLEKQKEYILSNKKLGYKAEVKAIDDKINSLKEQVALHSPVLAAFSTITSKMWDINPESGYLELSPTKFEAISKEDYQNIDKSITDEHLVTHEQLLADLGQFRNNPDNQKLYSLLRQRASLQGGLNKLQSEYVDTHTKVVSALDNYNITFTKMFQEIMDNAVKDMVKYAKKYNTIDKPGLVQQVLQEYLDKGDESQVDKRGISDEDFKAMVEHLKAINIKSRVEDVDPSVGIEQRLGFLMSQMEQIDKFNDMQKKESDKVKQQVQPKPAPKKTDTPDSTTKIKEDTTVKPSPAPKKSQKEIDIDNQKSDGIQKYQGYDTSKTTDRVSFYNNMALNDVEDNMTEAIKMPSGNYVLKADSDEYVSNQELYAYTAGYDAAKPAIVKSHPYVEIKDGKVRVIKQGIVGNATSSTTGTEVSSNPPVEEKEGTDTTVEQPNPDTVGPSEEANNLDAKISTAEEEVKKEFTGIPYQESVLNGQFLIEAAYLDLVSNPAVLTELVNKTDEGERKKIFNKIRQDIISVFAPKGYSDAYIKQCIHNSEILLNNAARKGRLDTSLANLRKQLEDNIINQKIGSAPIGVVESGIIAIKRAAAFNILNPSTFGENMKQYIEDFLTEYCKRTAAAKVGDKYYFSLAPLFEYAVADESLFPIIAKYLNENSDKFVAIEDLNNADAVLFSQEIPIETTSESIRIDIWDLLEAQTPKGQKEFWKVFESLQQGEKIEFKLNNDKIYVLNSDGKVLGYLRKPTVKGTCIHTINDGLVWELTRGANNFYLENDGTKDTVVKLINSLFDTKLTQYADVQQALFELAFGKHSAKETQNLEDVIFNSPLVQSFSHLFVKDKEGNPNKHQIVNGFVKLAKYALKRDSKDETFTHINNRINAYYHKIYMNLTETHNIAENLANGVQLNYAISNIVEGKYIKGTGKVADMTVASKAIANLDSNPKHKNAHRIGIALGDGRISIAGVTDPSVTTGKQKFKVRGNTFIAMPIRGNSLNYIAARALNLSEIPENHPFKQTIVKDYQDYIISLLNDITDANDNIRDFAKQELKRIFGEELSTNAIRKEGAAPSIFNGLSSYVQDGKSPCIYFTDKNGEPSVFYLNLEPGTQGDTPVVGVKNRKTGDIEYKKYDLFIKDDLPRIINSLNIRLDMVSIDGDAKTKLINEGMVRRTKDGKFRIAVPVHGSGFKMYDFDSFNQFILDNDLIKVDTKIENGSNYVRANTDDMVRATIEIKSVEKTGIKTKYQFADAPIETFKSKLKDITESDSTNKAIEIINLIADHASLYDNDFKQQIQPLLDLINDNKNDFFMLPEFIKFVYKDRKNSVKINKLNHLSIETAEGVKPGAYAHREGNEVRIGLNFVSLLDFKNQGTMYSPAFAITTLIHEELHGKFKLNENKEYVQKCRGIYVEFVNSLKGKSEDIVRNMSDYVFTIDNHDKISDADLEEFVIRSLTDSNLQEYLNSVNAEDATGKPYKNKTIFQKILETVAKLFGVNIREGSLLHKEYLALGKLISNLENNAKIHEITSDSSSFTLTEDEKSYVDTKNKYYARTTSTIKSHPAYPTVDPNDVEFLESYKTVATNIGTGTDEFVRDYFAGKLGNMSNKELAEHYPNATAEDFGRFKEQLDRLAQYFKDNNITIIPKDVTVNGKVPVTMPDGSETFINVVGTVDLLGVDKDGNWHLYDMKTMHSDKRTSEDELKKWSLQLSLYKDFLEKKYTIKITDMHVIPIKVSYDNPINSKNPDGATYTVKNQEKARDYNDPNRSQLLQDGQEFREASPELYENIEDDGTTSISLVPIDYTNISLSYQNVVDNFGTDVSKYLDADIQEVNNEDDDSDPLNEDTYDNTEDTEDSYSEDEIGSLDDIPESSVVGNSDLDVIDRYNNYADVQLFLEHFEPQISSKLASLVARGEISISCR